MDKLLQVEKKMEEVEAEKDKHMVGSFVVHNYTCSYFSFLTMFTSSLAQIDLISVLFVLPKLFKIKCNTIAHNFIY